MVEPLFDVGLHLMHDGSSWVVTSIDNSGSAASAGVMPGDVLSHINGNSVATLSSRQISALLRGTAGSHCSLSLWRNTVGGGSAHLEARVQRKIPSHPESFSPRELPELASSSHSAVYADPEDSDPDAEAKLHAQLSQISQRLDEMEQKIRAPNAHSDKLMNSTSSSSMLPAVTSVHPGSASTTSAAGNGIFSLKSPARPRPALRTPSSTMTTPQSAVPQSPSRTSKSSAAQPQRSPAMRSTIRPSSASASSPSKFVANTAASIAADHGTPKTPALSSILTVVDKTREVKSNLFPSHHNASNEAASTTFASAVTDHAHTFLSSSQTSPLHHPRDQAHIQQKAQSLQHSVQSTPPRDQQQQLQLQQLLQKLLRQVEDAERQRLELDSLRADDERRRQDTVRVACCCALVATMHRNDTGVQVSSFESRLNKVISVQDDLWEDISKLRRDVKIAFEDMTSQMNSSLAAISRQIIQSSPVKGSSTPLLQHLTQEPANYSVATAAAVGTPSKNEVSPLATAAALNRSAVMSLNLTLLPRAASGMALIPLRHRGCMVVLPFLSDERLLLGDALLLSPHNMQEGGSQLLTGASKSASLSISISSPLRAFALSQQVVILPVGASGMLDLSTAWIMNVEKASLSKALGPSASAKFQGACSCSLLDRFVVCLSTEMTTMVLDGETQMVKSGTAANLPTSSMNQVRFLFSASTYVVCASVTSSRKETGHYVVNGFSSHAVSFCEVIDPRNLAFKSFQNSSDHVIERAFVVLGATGFYVLAVYDNDGDAIDLAHSMYFDVRAGASFSVDSDGSIRHLLQSSGNLLPRCPIRCTPKSLAILCGNVNKAAVLVISSSQLELLRCPVDIPPRTRSWLSSCVPSSPIGWMICLDSEGVPLIMLRVTFVEDGNGCTVVAQSKVEQVSAVLPSHGISLLGDGVHTVIALSRRDKDFGDASCIVGRHLAAVKDFVSPSSASPGGSSALGSLV